MNHNRQNRILTGSSRPFAIAVGVPATYVGAPVGIESQIMVMDRHGSSGGRAPTDPNQPDGVRTTEEALRESEKRYRGLFESSRDAVMTLEPPSWKFTSGNPATVEMFRAESEEDFITRGPWELSPEYQPDGRASAGKAREMIETAMREGSHFFEWTHRRLTGEDFPATVLLTRVELAEIRFLQATVRDITEQWRTQESLREANRRLEQSLEELRQTQEKIIQQERLSALGQMASGIAHDFNNALMPIVGYANFLLSNPNVLDDKAEATDMIETILSAGNDARQIVSRLRAFYRKGDDARCKLVDIAGIVESAFSLTKPKWKEEMNAKGSAIEVAMDLRLVPRIRGNESELREAVMNLILNATDAMPTGGTISCRLSSENDSSIALEVTDTGLGMDQETLRRCMEPFFTTKGNEGSGLGLAMVHGITERHGGGLEIESKPGKGTTIRMRFPVPVQTEDTEEKPKNEPVTLPPMRVLVTDDEVFSRDIIARLLESKGHRVEAFEGGREGLDALRQREFDLVITDRAMSSVGGDAVARMAQEIRPGIPVIMLTGFGGIMKDSGECPRGVVSVMSKPVTSAELEHVMAGVMSGLRAAG